MIKKLMGVAIVSSVLGMMGCSDSSSTTEMATVQGEVYYLPRISLPENANVTVTLSDVSLADASAKVVSSQTFVTEGKQVPLPFELTYSPSDINTNHTYSLSAKIDVDGKMVFNSHQAYPVITDAAKTTTDVQVQVVPTQQ